MTGDEGDVTGGRGDVTGDQGDVSGDEGGPGRDAVLYAMKSTWIHLVPCARPPRPHTARVLRLIAS